MQPTYSNRLTTLKSRAMIEHRDIQDHTTKSKQMQYLLDVKMEKLRLLQNLKRHQTNVQNLKTVNRKYWFIKFKY